MHAPDKHPGAAAALAGPPAHRLVPLGGPPARTGQLFIPCPERREDPYQWDDVRDLGTEDRRASLHPHIVAAIHGMGAAAKSAHVQKKISAGLILVRSARQTLAAADKCGGRSEYQAVVVKGRVSYAFNEFVQGNYDPRCKATVRQLIAHMAVEERLDVYSLDFDRMWERVCAQDLRPVFTWRANAPSAYERLWMHTMGRSDMLYAKKRDKFRGAWMQTEAASQLLRDMALNATGAGESRWEFPKGKRLSPKETDLRCAVREFCEETGIPGHAFSVVPGFARVDMYAHMGVLYVTVYYLAVLTRDIPHPESCISLRNTDQVPEVTDVTWMGVDMLRRVNGPVGRDLSVLGRQAFYAARNYIRGRPARPVAPHRPAPPRPAPGKRAPKKAAAPPPPPRGDAADWHLVTRKHHHC